MSLGMQEQDLQGTPTAPIRVHLNRSKGYRGNGYESQLAHAVCKHCNNFFHLLSFTAGEKWAFWILAMAVRAAELSNVPTHSYNLDPKCNVDLM